MDVINEDKNTVEFEPQRQIVYNKLLPYAEHIPQEAVIQLKEIKENLSKSVILKDIRSGCVHWTVKLTRYIKIYGFYFSKEDHILFIKLFYQLLVIPEQEFFLTEKFANVFNCFLKKRKLISPEELTLPWKPLSDTYLKLFNSSYKTIGLNFLPSKSEFIYKAVICSSRPYFSPDASYEILDFWRPRLCPSDSAFQHAISMLELFLPTLVPLNRVSSTWKLWIHEFIEIWTKYKMTSSCSNTLFCLLARLTYHNVGLFNWEPFIPYFYTRILSQFDLPVTYKKVSVFSRRSLQIWAVSMFIVGNLGGGSQTQMELERLFKMLESYFHPSNYGFWSRSLNDLLVNLTKYFVQRLYNERYRKLGWLSATPSWKRLTEADIDAFVDCLKGPAALAVFAKGGAYDAGRVMHQLALLRPQVVIPPLVEQLHTALETTTEPHRLIALLQCVVSVVPPMVAAGSRPMTLDGEIEFSHSTSFAQGPLHVIPLLFEALPGIDPNDINKCMMTFQFIASLVVLVPLVDCSAAPDVIDDLNEIELELCMQTSSMENWVLEFVSRCTMLVESMSLDSNTSTASAEQEREGATTEDSMVHIGLSSTLKTVLAQSHPKIFKSALERMLQFTKGRCFETKVAGKLLASMWRSAVKVNAEQTFNLLMPHACRVVLSLAAEADDAAQANNNQEYADPELMFNLLLLSEMMMGRCAVLVPWVPRLTEVLHSTLHLRSVKVAKMALSVLRNMLWSLTMAVVDMRFSVHPLDAPFDKFFPIRHWGEPGDIKDLGMSWFEFGEAEEAKVRSLVHTFLLPEIKFIKGVTEGEVVLRETLHQSLQIIQAILYAGYSLPIWEDDVVELYEMQVSRKEIPIKTSNYKMNVVLDAEEEATNGENNAEDLKERNVRLTVANAVLALVARLLHDSSDDTKTLVTAAGILKSVCSPESTKREEVEKRRKRFKILKLSMRRSVNGKKRHIRALLTERALLQNETRSIDAATYGPFTRTHERIIKMLFRLSTSYYSEVRKVSQRSLHYFLRNFSYVYRLLVPDIIAALSKDPSEHHKEFKGTLYTLSGMWIGDWETMARVWTALLSAPHSEKKSVIHIYEIMQKGMLASFDIFDINIQVPEFAVSAARALLSSYTPRVRDGAIEDAVLGAVDDRLHLRSKENLFSYQNLINDISKLLLQGNLHWRRELLGLNMSGILIRTDVTFPVEGVQTFIHCINSDVIFIRKLVLLYLPVILKTQKQIHKRTTINPRTFGGGEGQSHWPPRPANERDDNRWLQYDPDILNMSEDEWNQKIFVHKTWHGWYCWPQTLSAYAPASEQPQGSRLRELLKEEEKPIYDFFSDADCVRTFISFCCLEENKKTDRFDYRKFFLFKGLFRNFGDSFLDLLEPHLERLVAESQEKSQRCAAEMIAGLLRGTKHWQYSSCMRALHLCVRLLRSTLRCPSSENVSDWNTCLSNCSMDRDPKRIALLIEMLMKDTLPLGESSAVVASRLSVTSSFMRQQEWRVIYCHQQLLKLLEMHLANPYKSIRDVIGLHLSVIFTTTENEKLIKFIDSLVPQLAPLILEGGGGAVFTDLCSPHADAAISRHSLLLDAASTPRPLAVEALLSDRNLLNQNDSSRDLHETSPPAGAELEPMEVSRGSKLSHSRSNETLPSVMLPLPSLSGNSFGGTEEKRVAVNLMNTVCKFISYHASNCNLSISTDLYKLLPFLCQLENVDSDIELRNNCIYSLSILSRANINCEEMEAPLNILQSICQSGWWRARLAALSFLQVLVFTNMFALLENATMCEAARQMVLTALRDERVEVRQMASQVLAGMFHSNFIIDQKGLLNEFTNQLNSSGRGSTARERRIENRLAVNVTKRHSAALVLTAFVSSFPYDVPPQLPEVVVTLSNHINDVPPISTDIKQALSHFKRTHYDNWAQHKQAFTSDQLVTLTDVLVSPSYYA